MKIVRMETTPVGQAGVGVGKSKAVNTDFSFSAMLKGQEKATSGKEDVAGSTSKAQDQKDQKVQKEDQPSVEKGDSQEKAEGKTEDVAEKKDNGQENEAVSAELLLQLQNGLNQMVAEPQLEGEGISEPAGLGETAAGLGKEAVTEMDALQDVVQKETGELLGAVQEEAQAGVPIQNQGLFPAAEGFVEETKGAEAQIQSQGLPQENILGAVEKEADVNGGKEETPKLFEGTQESQATVQEMGQQETVSVKDRGPADTSGEGKKNTGSEEMPETLRAVDLHQRDYSFGRTEQEGTAVVKTTPSTMAEDLGQALASRFPQSNGSLTIELEPASLGKLTINVLYESGKATVSILATNPRTLEILNQKATELASILEERTGQETVIFTPQPEAQQPYDERQGQGGQPEREPERQNGDSQERRNRESQDSFAQQLRLGLV